MGNEDVGRGGRDIVVGIRSNSLVLHRGTSGRSALQDTLSSTFLLLVRRLFRPLFFSCNRSRDFPDGLSPVYVDFFYGVTQRGGGRSRAGVGLEVDYDVLLQRFGPSRSGRGPTVVRTPLTHSHLPSQGPCPREFLLSGGDIGQTRT